MKKLRIVSMGFLLFFALAHFMDVYACSVFRVTAKDGTIISGRTMEFGHDMGYAMIVVPRNKNFASPAPDGITGLKWKTRYGYVASNVLNKEDGISDGINEAGLSFSLLWYDGDMQWQVVNPKDKSPELANIVFGSWVLGNFSTVKEAVEAIAKVKVFGIKNPELGGAVLPGHFILYDAKGDCVVIEYEKGELHIYDNPLGIMTNAPNFPWMLTNLRNYVGMTNGMREPATFGGQTYLTTGHGSGMFGLPGDITPPARFVRMAVTTRFADTPENAENALNLAQHIVSSLHIVRGMAADRNKEGKIIASETTQWSTYRDLTNRVYYFRTYDNFNLRKIDLKRLNFNADKIKTIPMFADKEIIVDVTDRGK
ncbi:MAG: choloylglycine hydrolase [Deltaproteobacteria bacterium HGW-Deltaproteobacteria-6]|jgi:choloylglycine hydrolase|nr:MAG: choloylglycine hydrolase [Deltaproteobacteria bacterium HGW-Deltaproteobacteria-6]PKN96449.1 MAG: choloylglycine hydrolase [Chloroflexi bacterium HGW-Chloroflexi-5]